MVVDIERRSIRCSLPRESTPLTEPLVQGERANANLNNDRIQRAKQATGKCPPMPNITCEREAL
ncbi:hypothetical protein CCL09_18265 [Pseudomonas congelans]|nr:hypothetical protein CCL09_18265 [Pseudomonas congelans]